MFNSGLWQLSKNSFWRILSSVDCLTCCVLNLYDPKTWFLLFLKIKVLFCWDWVNSVSLSAAITASLLDLAGERQRCVQNKIKPAWTTIYLLVSMVKVCLCMLKKMKEYTILFCPLSTQCSSDLEVHCYKEQTRFINPKWLLPLHDSDMDWMSWATSLLMLHCWFLFHWNSYWIWFQCQW